MSALIYWFCALIVLAAVVFPGYLVSRLLFRKLDDGEHLCVGPFLSIPIVVVLWLLIRPLGDVVWTTVFLVGVLICSAAALRRGQLRRGLPLLILATLAGHLVVCGVVQLFWDSPHAGGDFFLHIFRVPYAFLNNDSLAGDRTALFSLFSMAFSGSFGGDLRDQWLYQLSFVVGNSLILAPMVLFAHRFGGPLAGRIALVVGIVNPYFIFNAVFTWPKLISSAAVMVSVYLLFYHRSKLTSAAAAFVAAIGVFCHPSAGILLLPAGLVWLFRRGFKSRLGELLVAIMTVAITFLVFFFWTTSKGYAPGASVLLKCPILVEGWQTGYGVPWPEAWQRFCDATIGEILDRRVTTFLASFTPSTGNPTPYYHESVPGALGVFVLVGSMIGSVSLWRRAKPQRPVRALLVLMLLWPLVAIVFSGCEYTGLGETLLMAFFATLVAIFAYFVAMSRDWRPWVFGVLVETAFLAWWWVHVVRQQSAVSKQLVDPRYDDFVERDLWNIPEYEPADMVFAQAFAERGSGFWLTCIFGCLSAAGLAFWLVRDWMREEGELRGET